MHRFHFPLHLKKILLSLRKIDFVTVLLIFLGMIIQLVPVWGFGLQYEKGMYLCCANREDLTFHLALVESLVKNIPPYEPGVVGVLVTNYHYWSNLVVAELVRVFSLPAEYTQFQYMTFFVSLFFGLGVLTFGSILRISKAFTRWLIFFAYFGGDAIFLLFLFLGKGLSNLKIVSSLEDGSVFLINPPRAYSIVIAFAALALFVIWIRDKKRIAGFLTVFLFASAIGFKVYTGFFALIGFSMLIPYFLYKRQIGNAFITTLVYPLSAIIYFSTNASSGGIFWAPFQMPKDFIVQQAFGLERLELARQIFLADNKYIRVLQYELLFTAIFLLSICGTKIIAFFQSYHSLLRLGKELSLFLYTGMIGSLVLGLFFLQNTGGANTFNFIVSFWVFLLIPASLALDYLQRKLGKASLIFVVIMVILTMPRVAANSFFNASEYSRLGYLFITNEELKALKMLQLSSENGFVAVDPDFYLDTNTPFVYAFTKKQMFLSGEGILESHGFDPAKKKIIKKEIFKSSNPITVANALLKNNISYLYLWEKNILPATQSAYFTKELAKGKNVTLLQVDRELVKKYIGIKE